VQKIASKELNGSASRIGYLIKIDDKLLAALESVGLSITIEDLLCEVNDCSFRKRIQPCNINSTLENSNSDTPGEMEMSKSKSEVSLKKIDCETSRMFKQRRLFEDPHSISEKPQSIDHLTRENSMARLDLLFLITPRR
jgi:hypothetical protein